MKKNLIALAIFGAFSGAALAQSNVTLYGIIDVGYQYNDPESGSSTSGIQSGHPIGKPLGYSGFGSAVAQPERGVHARKWLRRRVQATSLQGGRLFGRQAWGGLVGQLGHVGRGPDCDVLVGHRFVSTCSALIDPFGPALGDSSLGLDVHTPPARCGLTTRCCTSRPSGVASDSAWVIRSTPTGQEVAGSGNNTRAWFTGVFRCSAPSMRPLHTT